MTSTASTHLPVGPKQVIIMPHGDEYLNMVLSYLQRQVAHLVVAQSHTIATQLATVIFFVTVHSDPCASILMETSVA